MNGLWDIRIFLGLVPKESSCIIYSRLLIMFSPVNRQSYFLFKLNCIFTHIKCACSCNEFSWGDVVDIATKLRAGRAGVRNFLFVTPTTALGSILPPIQWVQGFFPGVKRLRRDANDSPLFGVEIKNHWSHASTQPESLRGVGRWNVKLMSSALCLSESHERLKVSSSLTMLKTYFRYFWVFGNFFLFSLD
jgi:hypothetical protein